MASKRTPTRRRPAAPTRKSPASKARPGRKWSARVMQRSDALDLEAGVFTKRSARQIAQSLKRSAQQSNRRKAKPFQSAMSMLNFQINRGGARLTAERRRVLNQAKVELRKLFHRAPD